MNSGNHARFASLDRSAKYCLVNTMVLLPICYGDSDVTHDVRRELNGAALVLLNKVVGGVAYRHGGQEDGREDHYADIALLLSRRLESVGRHRVQVRMVRPRDVGVLVCDDRRQDAHQPV